MNAEQTAIVEEDAAERRELEVEAAAEVAAEVEPETERAAYTRGLREIADFYDAHPEVKLPYLTTVMTGKAERTFPVYLSSWDGDQREQLAGAGRALGRFEKFAEKDDNQFVIYRRFGGIALAFQADRDEVCERVVLGTEEVTEEVPDPVALAAVPKVSVTKTVEQVQWRCMPLLADAKQVTAAPLADVA